jgi:hypothetical protein
VSCTGSSQNHFLNIGSKETTLSSRLDKQSVGENASSITIDCIMDLVMKKGRKVYSTPETEKVNITIPLYNNPLGEISESMKGKIADVNGEIKGLQDDIDKWEQWNMWLSMLCSMAESLGKLNSLLESIKSIMWAVDCAWSGNPITKAAAVAHWIQGCATITKYNFYVESFVWPTGLIGPSPIGMSVKYGCMLYSCRLCDWSTYMSVGVSAAGAALSPKTVQDTGWTTLSDDQNILGDGQNEMMLKPFSTGNWRWTGGETYTISHDEVDLGGDIIPETEPGSSGDLPLLGSLTNPSYKDYWADSAKKTELLSTGDSSKWIYDPYKSIHYATACLCLPGYIYNLKKDRQIKCLYRTCLEDSSKAGLPTDTCDESYAERECLYVDSAQFKEHGYMPAFDNMINALVQMLPSIVIGIAYSASCPDFKIDPVGFSCQEVPGDVCTNARAATCGLSGAAAAILEMSDIMSGGLSFSKYNTDLGGTDYCSGGSQ